MAVTLREVPLAVFPSQTSFCRIFLEVVVSNQALLTLLSSVEAGLALVGHGAMLSSLEGRNTVAARMYQVLQLVKQRLAVLTKVSAKVYVAMDQNLMDIYDYKIILINISIHNLNTTVGPNSH